MRIARALTWRYVIALTLVAMMTTAAWISLHLVITEQKSTAAVVNISGRQRMLSQRTALFSVLLVQAAPAERPALRRQLQEAVDLMQRSHRGLIHGDAEMGLPTALSPAVRAMYFDGPNALDRLVSDYIGSVHGLLATADEALAPDSPHLRRIVSESPTILVSSLDRMVSQYQREGEAAIGRLQVAETLVWLVTLVLLLLEAAFIFRPFARRMQRTLARLQKTTEALFSSRERLRMYQDHLEELVEERTEELERKRGELAESEEKFRLISGTASDAIIMIDPAGLITYWNQAARNMFGYDGEEVLGRDLHDLLAPPRYLDDIRRGFRHFLASGEGRVVGRTMEIQALRKGGEEFPIELSTSGLLLKGQRHAIGIVRDISERKQAEERIRQLAYYDTLTDLPNRRLLLDRLEQALTQARRHRYAMALLFIDLDGFKNINDTLGHHVGDDLLKTIAARLNGAIRCGDTVCRQGGDEFVVILARIETRSDASMVAEKLITLVREPVPVGEYELTVSASVGIAVAEASGHGDIHEFMKRADMAMYAAKRAGRDCYRYFGAERDAAVAG